MISTARGDRQAKLFPEGFQKQNVDRLESLFTKQRELNKKIGIHLDNLSDDEKADWIQKLCRAMSQEIAELTDSVPWKWWSKHQKLDLQNAKVEVIDLLHFLISTAQALGMNADDVFEAYEKKHQVNIQRQQSGYSTKDDGDCKHI